VIASPAAAIRRRGHPPRRGGPNVVAPNRQVTRFHPIAAVEGGTDGRYRLVRRDDDDAAYRVGLPTTRGLAWRGSATRAFGCVGSSVFRDLAATLTSQIGVVCQKRLEAEE
jgi:hypothetical protein